MKKALFCGFSSMCLFAVSARAQPNATYSLLTEIQEPLTVTDPVSGTAGSGILNVSSSVDQTQYYNANASASATAVGGSDPTVTASATYAGVAAYANSTINYYFEVNGTTNVPLVISGTYTDVNGGGNTVGSAILSGTNNYNDGGIYAFQANRIGTTWSSTDSNSTLGTGLAASGTITGNDVIHWSTTIYVVPSEVFELSIYVNTNSTAGVASSAQLDPTISIDPTFLAANPTDSISFSPGFSAVPEPSTYALFAGVAALGYGVIRRKRVTA